MNQPDSVLEGSSGNEVNGSRLHLPRKAIILGCYSDYTAGWGIEAMLSNMRHHLIRTGCVVHEGGSPKLVIKRPVALAYRAFQPDHWCLPRQYEP